MTYNSTKPLTNHKICLGRERCDLFAQIGESGPVTNPIKFLWGNEIRNAKINVADKATFAAEGHRDTKDFKSTETKRQPLLHWLGLQIKNFTFYPTEAAGFASGA